MHYSFSLLVLLEYFLIIPIYLADSFNLRDHIPVQNYSQNAVFDSYYQLTELEGYPDVCDEYSNENCAIAWLDAGNDITIRNENRLTNAYYKYSTNITKINLKIAGEYQKHAVELMKSFQSKAKKFQWQTFENPTLRNIFEKLTLTMDSRNQSISQRLIDIKDRIDFIYNNGKPCFKTCLPTGEPAIVDYFLHERDYDKLAGFWTAWRNATGSNIRNLFIEMVNLENKGAIENGYTDAASLKLFVDFDEEHFEETAMKLFESIFPFYQELHAYVRYCLSRYYSGKFDKNGPIPAHIFGNVWAEQWTNIFPIIQQCMRNSKSVDFLHEANERLSKRSVKSMFKMAESFYESLGMFKMTDEFWDRSMLQDPRDRIVDCHPSSTDFANGRDFRIIMCSKKNLNDLTFIHHEMGHIQYFMAYRNLPFLMRGSANVGLQETIGDTIILAVRTPSHLHKVGLLSQIPDSPDFDIDYLMALALEKVSFIPHAVVMDSYIREVYNGSIPVSELNKRWWQLKFKYQGIKPPIERSENDFDPGSKYHIAFGIPYIRYLFSFIVQYQFYESMCDISGYKGKLHRCDFYHSKEAGSRLLEMLKQGQSRPWRETIKILTGTKQLQSMSLLKFFEPLYKWLQERNRNLNIRVGW